MFYECKHMEHKYENLYRIESRQPQGMEWLTLSWVGGRGRAKKHLFIGDDLFHNPGAGNVAAVCICPRIFHVLNIS